MKPGTISLLCSPGKREELRLDTIPAADGGAQEVLVGIRSGDTYRIRDGIPLLLDETKVSGFNRQYQGIYNSVAGLYDGSIKLFAYFSGSREERFRMQYLSELEVYDGDRLLEVSVGTGANLHLLPARAACFGLDLSWGMLKTCQKNLNHWHLEAELILGNAEELPLRDGSFDSVLHVGGINAFNNRSQAIREMIRVAKMGTKIVIVDETVKLLESFAWAPGVRRWLREHRERFSAPVALIPEGMREVHAAEIAGGNLYCLTFRKA